MDLAAKNILVTGGHGFIGRQVLRALSEKGVPQERISAPTMAEADLRDGGICARSVAGKDVVIHLAAKVGGIGFNRDHPAELFYDNIMMGTQLMDAAFRAGVEKFVGLATICSYPKFAPIPFKEESMWDGYPEETNAPYGLAKKMLMVQAQAYRAEYNFNAITLFPVNNYGPGDNFDPRSSHVIAALIRKIHEAKLNGSPEVEVWGTGRATRGFIYVEDTARAIVLATEKYDKPEPVNIGSAIEISIKDLAELIMELMDYRGAIRFDVSKPDGQPRRALDTSRAEREFGFVAKTDLREGLKKTIEWYLGEVAVSKK